MSGPFGSSQWMYKTGGFYPHEVDQSLKFNDDDSTYLSKTPASASNRKTFTYSSWVKRGKISADNPHWGMSAGTLNNSSNARTEMLFNPSDNIVIGFNTGSWYESTTNAKFRDTSAWYHFCVSVDMTQSTASDRLKFYVNGELQTFSSYSVPSQNTDLPINNTLLHGIGEYIAGESSASYQFDGYLAEINFIDGTALTAASFGETKDGIWVPKDTSGLTFGTNGFRLTFKDDVVSEGFNAVTYTGTEAVQSISGLGFNPALVWIKGRDTDQHHNLFDVMRTDGDGPRRLYSSLAVAEESTVYSGTTNVSSLDADGFTMGNATSVNEDNKQFVAWCWEADTSFSNDASATSIGNVDCTGRTNTAKGFSIISWTYTTSSDNLVAHGLGAVPTFMIIKSRTTAYNWDVYHSGLSAATKRLLLNNNGGEIAGFFDTTPTSTVFEYNTSAATNSDSMIAYCWTDVAGYSKFGTYTGNGSSSGPTVSLGFEPAWIMIKNASAVENWYIWDNTREPFPTEKNNRLHPNLNIVEQTSTGRSITFSSSGFQVTGADSSVNGSGNTLIYMAFADTREAAFFKDVSGQGNNFTPVNLDYRDSVPDVPTNNFAVGNPSSSTSNNTFAEGNLKVTGNGVNYYNYLSSMAMPTGGKYYFEVYSNRRDSSYWAVGICETDSFTHGMSVYNTAGSMALQQGQSVYYLNSAIGTTTNRYNSTAYLFSFAIDLDNNIFHFRADGGTWENSGNPAGGTGGYAIPAAMQGKTLLPWFGPNGGNFQILNFGQDSSFAGNHATSNSNADGNGHGSFAYAPPSGFLALCSQNLPDVDIIDGSENFNTLLWTGDGTDNRSITGVGFQPDFTWVKARNATEWHNVYDAVRGANKAVYPNSNYVEETLSETFESFNSDGFTASYNSSYSGVFTNKSGTTYVAWNWLAATAFSNDASATGVGTIDCTGRVNTTAGLSIISYTGNGATGATVAHGLSSALQFYIIKNRDSGFSWTGYHEALGSGNYIQLNDPGAATSTSDWNSTAPTSSVFTVSGDEGRINKNGTDYIAYCFHSVEGYSKVGSYVGSGSSSGTAGPYVHLGFRPTWVMLKRTDSTGSWWILDSARDPHNEALRGLVANAADAETGYSGNFLDFYSNGFAPRTSGIQVNASSGTYIYLAFGEQPAKYSNAR